MARVTNGHNFSYPGYNELLSGRADPRIDSNDKKPNPNVTVLEWLDGRDGYGAGWPRSAPGTSSPGSSTASAAGSS